MYGERQLRARARRRAVQAAAFLRRRAIALWIDLAVPFCSAYPEAHAWSDWHCQRYLYTVNKRSAFHWLELNDVRREKGLVPVPLTGFVPNVAMPRRQRYWSE